MGFLNFKDNISLEDVQYDVLHKNGEYQGYIVYKNKSKHYIFVPSINIELDIKMLKEIRDFLVFKKKQDDEDIEKALKF